MVAWVVSIAMYDGLCSGWLLDSVLAQAKIAHPKSGIVWFL